MQGDLRTQEKKKASTVKSFTYLIFSPVQNPQNTK